MFSSVGLAPTHSDRRRKPRSLALAGDRSRGVGSAPSFSKHTSSQGQGESFATDLVDGDTNLDSDVFVRAPLR
jgi:hypothetical protein